MIEGGGAGASAAVGASAELERARLLHALGVDLLAASLPEAAHGFMQRALRSAPRREAELVAEIMGSLCVTLNQLGRHAEALRMAEAACELLGRRASVQLVAMQHNRSACLEFLGQRALALAATEEGLRLAASLRLGGGDALLGRLRAAQQKLAGQKLAPPHAEGSVPAHQPAKPAAAKGRAGREGPRPAPTAADLGATNAVLAQLLRRLAGTQEQGRGMAEQVEALQAQAAREGERRQRLQSIAGVMAALLGISADELQSLQAQRDGALQRLQGLQQAREREAARAREEASKEAPNPSPSPSLGPSPHPSPSPSPSPHRHRHPQPHPIPNPNPKQASKEALALAEASTREARASFDERLAEQARDIGKI